MDLSPLPRMDCDHVNRIRNDNHMDNLETTRIEEETVKIQIENSSFHLRIGNRLTMSHIHPMNPEEWKSAPLYIL